MDKIIEKRNEKLSKEVNLTNLQYQNRIGKSFREGKVIGLLIAGKTTQEIAKLLDFNERIVKKIIQKYSKEKSEA